MSLGFPDAQAPAASLNESGWWEGLLTPEVTLTLTLTLALTLIVTPEEWHEDDLQQGAAVPPSLEVPRAVAGGKMSLHWDVNGSTEAEDPAGIRLFRIRIREVSPNWPPL